MQADVVIAGGGIGGAVLAGLLGRGGKRVVVLERSTAPPNWLRPEILWPASVEVLFSLAPRRVWEQSAMLPLRGIRVHDGKEFVQLTTQEAMDAARVRPWFTNPNETREQLLRLGGFELRRGVEVTQVLKERERITGVRARTLATGQESEILAPWTVGDDGVHSAVRKACGIDMSTRLFPVEFHCATISWPDHLPEGVVCLWPNWGNVHSGVRLFGGGPLPGGKAVGLALVNGSRFDTNSDPAASWRRFCETEPTLERLGSGLDFPNSFARIKRPWGHAARYGAPGAVIMGDAAHSVSPAGGQGANMSIADAVVLAELFLRGEPDLIAEYERRRRPANERSLRPTRFAHPALGLPGWMLPNVFRRSLLRWLSRHPSTVQRALRSVSRLFQEKPVVV
jgi:2-polyprenyl-6-methoxyphenol hydroxylase-like FAD-dependent oxidoreductase